jgi:hypothetical protein
VQEVPDLDDLKEHAELKLFEKMEKFFLLDEGVGIAHEETPASADPRSSPTTSSSSSKYANEKEALVADSLDSGLEILDEARSRSR